MEPFRKEEVKERKGEYGLTHCIPVREVPSYEFHEANYEAGMQTYRQMIEVATQEDPPFPVAVEEAAYWKWQNQKEWAWWGGGIAAGAGAGAAATPYLVPSYALQAERLMKHRRHMFMAGGVAVTSYAIETLRLFDYHGLLCEGLQARTPLGDYVRATYDHKLSADLGSKGFVGSVFGVFRDAHNYLSDLTDFAVPGSLTNLLSNV
ncbi:hypothetical protein DIPPA_14558 [Diplonema papillatum]|nr:hypothetical protein DIPPA_14558 [Diplonema papillatum]|eukprot:gene22572-34545_t